VFNKSLVSVKNPVKAKGRDALMVGLQWVPVLGGWIKRMGMKPKPRFKRGAYLGLPRGLRGVEGTLSRQPIVRTFDGKRVRLDDAVGIGWSVIGIGVDPRDVLGEHVGTWQQLGATLATVYPVGTRPQGKIGDGARPGVIDLEDMANELTGWLRRAGVGQGSLLVLRPDKFVFGATRDGSLLTREVVRQLQLSEPARGERSLSPAG
jgi:3-(3-hydroxy-phenyl)propionate hydroxylase